jgi:hypothetical protein
MNMNHQHVLILLHHASDPHAPDYPYGELGAEQRARTLPAGR